MNLKFRYAGMQLTPKGVWVHFRFSAGTVVRHAEVLVPWAEFTDEHFTKQLDRKVQRLLMEKWSGLDTDPLF